MYADEFGAEIELPDGRYGTISQALNTLISGKKVPRLKVGKSVRVRISDYSGQKYLCYFLQATPGNEEAGRSWPKLVLYGMAILALVVAAYLFSK